MPKMFYPAMIKVPILDWLPTYSRSLFLDDAIAGLTVFVFIVPQGMGYAVLAGTLLLDLLKTTDAFFAYIDLCFALCSRITSSLWTLYSDYFVIHICHSRNISSYVYGCNGDNISSPGYGYSNDHNWHRFSLLYISGTQCINDGWHHILFLRILQVGNHCKFVEQDSA